MTRAHAPLSRTALTLLLLALAASIALIIGLTFGRGLPGIHLGEGGVNLVPGTEIERGWSSGAGGPRRNLVGNVLLFMPLGAVVAVLVRRGWWARVGIATLVGLALSTAIEALQYVAGRVADVDDVILNTGGALLGAVAAATLAAIWRRARGRHRPRGA